MKNVILDGYSFTAKLNHFPSDDAFAMDHMASALRYKLGDNVFGKLFDTENWESCPAPRAYKHGVTHRKRGITVGYGGQPSIKVSMLGVGCRFMDDVGVTKDVLQATASRATRIDIAVDLIGDVTPLEIVETLGNKRITSRAFHESTSGTTYSIGGRTSEYFCRVYRYHPPHPRSDRTRVEYEIKGKAAKICTAFVVGKGLEHVSDAMIDKYQWGHELLQKENKAVKALPSDRATRKESKTMSWLIKQCAPAFKRLVENGAIHDPILFLETYFLDINSAEHEEDEDDE